MKPFQSVKWDDDAENNTFQELFKKKKKNKATLVRSHLKDTKKKLNRTETNAYMNVSKFINKNILNSTDTVNLITPMNSEKEFKNKNSKRLNGKKTRKNINDLKREDILHESDYKKTKNKKLKTITDINLDNTPIINTKILKKNKKNLMNFQNNISKLIPTDLQSADLVNLLKSPIEIEKNGKNTKKKLKKSINTNNQSNKTISFTDKLRSKMQITHEENISLKKMSKNQKRRLKKLQMAQNFKMNKNSEKNSAVNNSTEINATLLNKTGVLKEHKKPKKSNQKDFIAAGDSIKNKVGINNNKKKKSKSAITNISDKVDALKNIPTGAVHLKTKITKHLAKLNKYKDLKEQHPTPNLVNKISECSKNKQKKSDKLLNKLKNVLENTKQKKPALTLRQKMMETLKAARFRFINEQIYTADSKEAQKIFCDDPDAFIAYHEGYRKQVQRWPLNPLDVIINSIKKMPKTHVVADFGCGDARLAKSVKQTVHSFDLIAINESVKACDMSKVPLENSSVDVTVFCLSLMGTNLRDYLLEANRVLKPGGILKIAEVESRFENVDDFVKGVSFFGFKNILKDQSHNLFYFLDFKKQKDVKYRNKLPTISLLPCLYKKR